MSRNYNVEDVIMRASSMTGVPGITTFVYGALEENPYMTIVHRCDVCGDTLLERNIDVSDPSSMPAPSKVAEQDGALCRAHLQSHTPEEATT